MIIYTIKEELYLIVYLFSYGVYLFATLDVIDQIIIKLNKKVLTIIINICYWLTQWYITYIFSLKLMDGYLPMYFILFIGLGAFIYIKLLKKVFLKTIKLILKLIKKIIKLLKPLVYSKEVVDTTKKSAKHYKRILENTFKIKTKNEK